MNFDFSKTFEHWQWSVPMRGEASLADFVCGGAKTFAELKPDADAIAALGSPNEPLKVLDFGCGFGRNLHGLPEKWEVTAYDNANMLKRVPEYYAARGSKLVKAALVSDWNELRERKFDAILASLVFQHVPPPVLEEYLKDLQKMTPRLVVYGRCWNDADNRFALFPQVEKYFKPAKPITFESLDDNILVVFESLVFDKRDGGKAIKSTLWDTMANASDASAVDPGEAEVVHTKKSFRPSRSGAEG